jgi:putative sterol carrier protein
MKSMADLTVQELMERLPQALITDKAEGISVIVQYHLTGDEGGDWIVSIKAARCTVEQGTAPYASLTLIGDAQDYKKVLIGKMNPMTAFMTGKLHLVGDKNLAVMLTGLFQV